MSLTNELQSLSTNLLQPCWISLSIVIGCYSIVAFGSRDFNETEMIPHFLVEPVSSVVRLSDPFHLRCVGSPEGVAISWLFNGTSISSRPDAEVDVTSARTLAISSFTSHHEGAYHCVARNSVGSVRSKEARLTIAGISQHAGKLQDRVITSTAGNVAIIPCVLCKSFPTAATEFELNGAKLQLSDRHLILPSGNMQIKAVNSSDQGSYRCISVNVLTNERMPANNMVILKVQNASGLISPKFVWTPTTNVLVKHRESVTLECAAEGWPIPVVTWLRYGGELVHSRHSQILGNLQISEIEKSDEGTYICRAENENGKLQANVVFVNVIESPTIIAHPQEQVVGENGTASIHCRVEGSPRQPITWLHNSDVVLPDLHINISGNRLMFKKLEPTHSGLYQCIASNAAGESSAISRLVVKTSRKLLIEETLLSDEVEKPKQYVTQASKQPGATTSTFLGRSGSRGSSKKKKVPTATRR